MNFNIGKKISVNNLPVGHGGFLMIVGETFLKKKGHLEVVMFGEPSRSEIVNGEISVSSPRFNLAAYIKIGFESERVSYLF